MGHHLDGKSSIVPLIDRLNKYPIGLPDNEKLRKILAILFSEEEAFLASRFPLEEATIKELVRATGWEKGRLEASLDKMADKGLVMDATYGDKTFYLLMPGLIGFFEFTFMKQRQDLPVAGLQSAVGCAVPRKFRRPDADDHVPEKPCACRGFPDDRLPWRRTLVHRQ